MASETDNTCVVPVRVHARGSRCHVQGVRDGTLHIKTTAPPVDGRANKDVIRQLAGEFRVPASHVCLKSGASGRNKVFVITGPRTLPGWLAELGRIPNKP